MIATMKEITESFQKVCLSKEISNKLYTFFLLFSLMKVHLTRLSWLTVFFIVYFAQLQDAQQDSNF